MKRKTPLREKISDVYNRGELFLHGWAKSPATFRIASEIGKYPLMWVDTEHSDSDLGPQGVQKCIDRAMHTDTRVHVRVERFDSPFIRRVLNFGADGIVVPQCRTIKEVQTAINLAKYRVAEDEVTKYGVSCAFPKGARGLAGEVCNLYEQDSDYIPQANDFTDVVVQIETAEAVDLIDEIVKLPGISALFIGPSDLSYALGVKADPDGEVMQDACQKVIEAANRHDIPVGTQGIFATPERLQVLLERGYLFAGYYDDLGAAIKLAKPPEQLA